MRYHFFGLLPEYKLGLHEEIFSLCYYGKGGFIWSEVYELPIHLRRFYINQVKKAVDERNKQEQELVNNSNSKKPLPPNFAKSPNK